MCRPPSHSLSPRSLSLDPPDDDEVGEGTMDDCDESAAVLEQSCGGGPRGGKPLTRNIHQEDCYRTGIAYLLSSVEILTNPW